MRDNEIIKALECCLNEDCKNCPNGNGEFAGCQDNFLKYALDLINRQKEEIELLNAVSEICGECHKKYAEKIEQVKSEAIKEFAERLKEKFGIADCIVTIDNDDIDNLVKEMTEVSE